MTRDTVAGESLRCSARNLRLMDAAEVSPRGREDATVLDRGMGCMVRVVWHNGVAAASGNAKFFANFWSMADEIQDLKTLEKSVYHWLVLVRCIAKSSYIPLDTAARPGVSCSAGVE
jgi:hypothetical protein